MDIDEVRRANIRALEKKFGPELAKRAGMSPPQFFNLRNGAKDSKTGKPRGMRKETARRIEVAAGVESGYLDVPHDESIWQISQAHQEVTQLDGHRERRGAKTNAKYVLETLHAMCIGMNDTKREMTCIALKAMLMGVQSVEETARTLDGFLAQPEAGDEGNRKSA